MQSNVLLKYKAYTQFLRTHSLDTYVEICNVYSETMSKLYLQNFKTYASDLQKVLLELYTKQDRVVSEQGMRTSLQAKGTELGQQTGSIFCLREREQILQKSQETPMVY